MCLASSTGMPCSHAWAGQRMFSRAPALETRLPSPLGSCTAVVYRLAARLHALLPLCPISAPVFPSFHLRLSLPFTSQVLCSLLFLVPVLPPNTLQAAGPSPRCPAGPV